MDKILGTPYLYNAVSISVNYGLSLLNIDIIFVYLGHIILDY